MPSETWNGFRRHLHIISSEKASPRSPLAAASVFHGVSVHRFQRNAQTAFPLKYCPDTRTRGVFIVPRHRPPNAQRCPYPPKRFRLFVIQHQLRRIGNGVVKPFSASISPKSAYREASRCGFQCRFLSDGISVLYVKVSRPEAGQKTAARPSVHRCAPSCGCTGMICFAANSPRFDHTTYQHTLPGRRRWIGGWQCCTTPLPVNLCQTAFAGGSGSRQKVRTGIVFFKYRLRIAFRQQAAADVRIRTCKQDILVRVATSVRRWSALFGEMAVNLPAFVLRIPVKPFNKVAVQRCKRFRMAQERRVCRAFPSQPACCLSNLLACGYFAHTRRRNRVFAAEHQQYGTSILSNKCRVSVLSAASKASCKAEACCTVPNRAGFCLWFRPHQACAEAGVVETVWYVGIIRTERADHFAQCRRGKPFGIIFGSRQPCEISPSGRANGLCRDGAPPGHSATNPPSDQPRMSAGVSICAATASAAASISEGLREGRVAVSEQIDGGRMPRCRQARHQIVRHVAVRPNRVSGKLFDGIRHGFSLSLAAHRERAHYQALRIMPRFVRRFRRHLRQLPRRFGGVPHRRGKHLPLCFRRIRRRGVRRLSEKTARIRPYVGFCCNYEPPVVSHDTRAEALRCIWAWCGGC